jgi:hypothetical protein
LIIVTAMRQALRGVKTRFGRRIGHRFRTDLTMADVIAEAHDASQLALIPLADIA